MEQLKLIKWISEWALHQCDGDWEHETGVRIIMLDNPGWNIEVDLSNENFEVPESKWQLFEQTNGEWLGFKVENDIFSAATTSVARLDVLLFLFKSLIDAAGTIDFPNWCKANYMSN